MLTSIKPNFSKIILIFLTTFILLEGGLRLIKWQLYPNQSFAEKIKTDDDRAYRILVLGESTSAPWPNIEVWPRRLERTINQKGNQKIRVYNEAVPGTTTPVLFKNLSQMLEVYRPSMIIAMVGINDYSHWKFKTKSLNWYSFLRNLKTINLLYSLKEALALNYSHKQKIEKKPKTTESLKKSVLSLNIESLNKQLGPLSPEEKRVYRHDILMAGYHKFNDTGENSSLLNLLADTFLKHYPNSPSMISFYMLIKSRTHQDLCIDVGENYIKSHFYPNPEVVGRLSLCADNSKRIERINKIFDLGIQLDDGSPYDAHIALYNQVKDKDIDLVLMQYPTLPVDIISNKFKNNDKNLFFISNQENFERALNVKNYDEVFLDRFAQVFGHTTEFGHSLIAENIINQLKEKHDFFREIRE